MPRPRVTIGDIARHAGVSKATVSRVLNNPSMVTESKRKAVLSVVGEMRFEPNRSARTLASGRSMTVGIVTQNIGTSFYDDVIRGIIRGLRGTGYSPIFGDGLYEQDAELTAIRTLIDRQIDGLIVLGGGVDGEPLDAVVGDRPVVVVARDMGDWKGVTLTADNFEMARTATRHLIELGHRRIFHVAGNPVHQDGVRRAEGYRVAMGEAGIDIESHWIYPGDFYGESGLEAVERWFGGDDVPPTAIFAANDLTAYGVRLGLYRRNLRVPDDVSLVGVDDKIESRLQCPPLTSVRQPAAEMGSEASSTIIQLMTDRDVRSATFDGRIQIRQSTAPLCSPSAPPTPVDIASQ